MGYLTRHVITIIPESKATQENYLRVRKAIAEVLEEDVYNHLTIYSNRMDDFGFNYGFGSKWYHNDCAKQASKAVPDLTIRFRCFGESKDEDALRDETYENGVLIEKKELNVEEFWNSFGYHGTYT
jgi:hypothetical protein